MIQTTITWKAVTKRLDVFQDVKGILYFILMTTLGISVLMCAAEYVSDNMFIKTTLDGIVYESLFRYLHDKSP